MRHTPNSLGLNALQNRLCYIKSASDIGSAVAHQLKTLGFLPLLVEQAIPTATRQHMCFASAAITGKANFTGMRAVRINPVREGRMLPSHANALHPSTQTHLLDCAQTTQCIPLLVRDLDAPPPLSVAVVVDARMRKKEHPPVQIHLAPLVIGIGPGFCAGQHCHAVIESNWGEHLGRVLWQGSSQTYTGVHRQVQGKGKVRYSYASHAGVFCPSTKVLNLVHAGDVLGYIMVKGQKKEAITARIHGMVRGIAYNGLVVKAGSKLAEIDPGEDPTRCIGLQERQSAIARGVAKAIATFYPASTLV